MVVHIKQKKETINPENDDDRHFKYASTIPLNFNEIKNDAQRVSNIKPFINNFNCEGINYSSKIEDWKLFEKNNPALSVLYTKEKEQCPAYISKINSNCKKQVILLMIKRNNIKTQH